MRTGLGPSPTRAGADLADLQSFESRRSAAQELLATPAKAKKLLAKKGRDSQLPDDARAWCQQLVQAIDAIQVFSTTKSERLGGGRRLYLAGRHASADPLSALRTDLPGVSYRLEELSMFNGRSGIAAPYRVETWAELMRAIGPVMMELTPTSFDKAAVFEALSAWLDCKGQLGGDRSFLMPSCVLGELSWLEATSMHLVSMSIGAYLLDPVEMRANLAATQEWLLDRQAGPLGGASLHHLLRRHQVTEQLEDHKHCMGVACEAGLDVLACPMRVATGRTPIFREQGECVCVKEGAPRCGAWPAEVLPTRRKGPLVKTKSAMRAWEGKVATANNEYRRQRESARADMQGECNRLLVPAVAEVPEDPPAQEVDHRPATRAGREAEGQTDAQHLEGPVGTPSAAVGTQGAGTWGYGGLVVVERRVAYCMTVAEAEELIERVVFIRPELIATSVAGLEFRFAGFGARVQVYNSTRILGDAVLEPMAREVVTELRAMGRTADQAAEEARRRVLEKLQLAVYSAVEQDERRVRIRSGTPILLQPPGCSSWVSPAHDGGRRTEAEVLLPNRTRTIRGAVMVPHAKVNQRIMIAEVSSPSQKNLEGALGTVTDVPKVTDTITEARYTVALAGAAGHPDRHISIRVDMFLLVMRETHAGGGVTSYSTDGCSTFSGGVGPDRGEGRGLPGARATPDTEPVTTAPQLVSQSPAARAVGIHAGGLFVTAKVCLKEFLRDPSALPHDVRAAYFFAPMNIADRHYALRVAQEHVARESMRLRPECKSSLTHKVCSRCFGSQVADQLHQGPVELTPFYHLTRAGAHGMEKGEVLELTNADMVPGSIWEECCPVEVCHQCAAQHKDTDCSIHTCPYSDEAFPVALAALIERAEQREESRRIADSAGVSPPQGQREGGRRDRTPSYSRERSEERHDADERAREPPRGRYDHGSSHQPSGKRGRSRGADAEYTDRSHRQEPRARRGTDAMKTDRR